MCDRDSSVSAKWREGGTGKSGAWGTPDAVALVPPKPSHVYCASTVCSSHNIVYCSQPLTTPLRCPRMPSKTPHGRSDCICNASSYVPPRSSSLTSWCCVRTFYSSLLCPPFATARILSQLSMQPTRSRWNPFFHSIVTCRNTQHIPSALPCTRRGTMRSRKAPPTNTPRLISP